MQFHAFCRTRSLCKWAYIARALAQNLYDLGLTLGVSLLMKGAELESHNIDHS